jgi:hypothetical protein
MSTELTEEKKQRGADWKTAHSQDERLAEKDEIVGEEG